MTQNDTQNCSIQYWHINNDMDQAIKQVLLVDWMWWKSDPRSIPNARHSGKLIAWRFGRTCVIRSSAQVFNVLQCVIRGPSSPVVLHLVCSCLKRTALQGAFEGEVALLFSGTLCHTQNTQISCNMLRSCLVFITNAQKILWGRQVLSGLQPILSDRSAAIWDFFKSIPPGFPDSHSSDAGVSVSWSKPSRKKYGKMG